MKDLKSRRVQEGRPLDEDYSETAIRLGNAMHRMREPDWVHEDPRCDIFLCYCVCTREGDEPACGCPPDPMCDCARPAWACVCGRSI